MKTEEIRALFARIHSKERKCNDEVGAEILAKSFPHKTYAEHLSDLQKNRAIRDAQKAKIRLENPEWQDWQVIDEVDWLPPSDWWEGDPILEHRFAWAGNSSS